MSMDGLLQPTCVRCPESKDRPCSSPWKVKSPSPDAFAKGASKLPDCGRRWPCSSWQKWKRNDNDNDNDTLREVPHRSNEGLALQARVSGPWHHKKESVLQVKLTLWQGASTNCCGQSVVHNGELNVEGRKKTRNRTGCCCAEFTINSRNLQIRSNTHKRTRSTGSQEAPGETKKPGQRPRRNAVRPRAAIVPAA